MRTLTIILPDEFVQDIDDLKGRMPGVRSRSAVLHVLASIGLKAVRDPESVVPMPVLPDAAA